MIFSERDNRIIANLVFIIKNFHTLECVFSNEFRYIEFKVLFCQKESVVKITSILQIFFRKDNIEFRDINLQILKIGKNLVFIHLLSRIDGSKVNRVAFFILSDTQLEDSG